MKQINERIEKSKAHNESTTSILALLSNLLSNKSLSTGRRPISFLTESGGAF